MISSKRIVEIFRTRGGRESIEAFGTLSPDQLAYITTASQGVPIIATISSPIDWFALTATHFVIERSLRIDRVPFADIYAVNIPKENFLNSRTKIEGGSLDLSVRGGARLRINVQPGGSYFGLMNVLMRMARINQRKPRVVRDDEGERPTTNDQRPTTQL